jgi:hypothetical protein
VANERNNPAGGRSMGMKKKTTSRLIISIFVFIVFFSGCSFQNKKNTLFNKEFFTFCDCDYNVRFKFTDQNNVAIKIIDSGESDEFVANYKFYSSTKELTIKVDQKDVKYIFYEKIFPEVSYGYVPGLKKITGENNSLPETLYFVQSSDFDILHTIEVEKRAAVHGVPEKEKKIFDAIISKKHDETIKILQNESLIDLETTDQNNSTILMHAVSANNLNIVKEIIIKKKSNINAQDGIKKLYGGNTALHLAVLFADVEMVEFLLENGADYNIENYNEQTPLMISRIYNRKNILNLLEKYGAKE